MIPIIIFHIGNNDYLRIAVKQAESFNNEVILIGDESNKDFCKKHYDWNEYINPLFASIYKHISPNNLPFEKICIERWMYILNFMKRHNIEKAFICDSDVLVYCNVDNIIDTFYCGELFISTFNSMCKVIASQSIWTIGQLEAFVDFIFDFYQDNDWEYITNYWNNYSEKIYGGISDMYLLYCFLTGTNFKDNHFLLDASKLKTDYDLSQPRYNCFFDNSIDNDSDTFKINQWQQKYYNFNAANMENKMKHFIFENGLPYCLNLNTHMKNRVYSIHFHGCKSLMSEYSTFPKKSLTNSTISAVVFSLNDNYTKDNKQRFIISINSMLDCVDEVVYIDWGSPNGISLLEDPVVQPNISDISKIKHLKFSREEIDRIIPPNTFFIQHSLIRNIGIQNASGDYIVQTNIDIIFPNRMHLLDIIHHDNTNTLYTINRKDIDINMVQAIYDVQPERLYNILDKYVAYRNEPNDIEPEANFRKGAYDQLKDNEKLYNCYVKYSKIWNCGDFQMAHKNIWQTIRGFEENMIETAYCTDSNVQRKVCNYGYCLKVLNYPHVYHMSHPHRTNNRNRMNDLDRFFIQFKHSENSNDWGHFCPINKSNNIEKKSKKRFLWISDYAFTGYTMVANCLIPYIREKYDIYFLVINECITHPENVETIKNRLFNYLEIPKERIYINTYDTNDFYNHLIGIYQLQTILKSVNPDYIFTLNDYQIITTQIEYIYNHCKFWNGIKMAYMPIDSENYKKRFFEKLNRFDYIFTMTQKSKIIIEDGGYRGKIMVMPHPISNDFYPKSDKHLLRKELYENKIDDNSIVIINNNNNSIRKRLDLTIESFYKLNHKYNGQKLYLILKTTTHQKDNVNGSLDIIDYINQMNTKYETNLSDRIIIDINKYSLEKLNDLYNCSDIYISTTSGEGWGFTAFEALQCNLYTLVPDNTSYTEYFHKDLLIRTHTKTLAEVRKNISVSNTKIDGYVFLQGYLQNSYSKTFIENIVHDIQISTIYKIDIENSNITLDKQFEIFKNLKQKPNSFEMYVCIDSPDFKNTKKFVEELADLDLENYFSNYNINIIPNHNFDAYIVKNKIVDVDNLCNKMLFYCENRERCISKLPQYRNNILKNLDNQSIGNLFSKYMEEI